MYHAMLCGIPFIVSVPAIWKVLFGLLDAYFVVSRRLSAGLSAISLFTGMYVSALDSTCGMGSPGGGETYAYLAYIHGDMPHQFNVEGDTHVFAIKFGCTKHTVDQRFNEYVRDANLRPAFTLCGSFRSYWAGIHEDQHFRMLNEGRVLELPDGVRAELFTFNSLVQHLDETTKESVTKFANVMSGFGADATDVVIPKFTSPHTEWWFYHDSHGSMNAQQVCSIAMASLARSWERYAREDIIRFLANARRLEALSDRRTQDPQQVRYMAHNIQSYAADLTLFAAHRSTTLPLTGCAFGRNEYQPVSQKPYAHNDTVCTQYT